MGLLPLLLLLLLVVERGSSGCCRGEQREREEEAIVLANVKGGDNVGFIDKEEIMLLIVWSINYDTILDREKDK